jgi:pimeloyl-ACP methyl ester carboxylesterase
MAVCILLVLARFIILQGNHLVGRGIGVVMRVRLGKVTVYYESFGKGRPFVGLHGFGPDHRLMKGCLEPVFRRRKGWRRIYPDLPGMGKTLAKDWIVNSDEMLEVVLEFLDKVVPNQRIVLAGESYGGYLARAVTQNKHRLVDGLLLICPLIIADQEKRKLPQPKVLLEDSEFLSALGEKDLADFKPGHVVLTRRIWERFSREVLPGLKAADSRFLQKIQEEGYAFSFDLEAFCRTFDKPSLLLAGRQDSSVGYSDAWSIMDKYPRMTFAVLDKAGHDLQIEQETDCGSYVRRSITYSAEPGSRVPAYLLVPKAALGPNKK